MTHDTWYTIAQGSSCTDLQHCPELQPPSSGFRIALPSSPNVTPLPRSCTCRMWAHLGQAATAAGRCIAEAPASLDCVAGLRTWLMAQLWRGVAGIHTWHST